MKIHPTAIVSKEAKLADDVIVGPYSVIGDNVTIGEATHIGAHCVIDGKTVIGSRCHIDAVLRRGMELSSAAEKLSEIPNMAVSVLQIIGLTVILIGNRTKCLTLLFWYISKASGEE